MSVIDATLTGTFHRPAIRMRFPRTARMSNGKQASLWVKGLPDRRWNPDERCWWITGLGPDPAAVLRRAKVALTADNEYPLRDLITPQVRLDPDNPDRVLIRSRLTGDSHVQQGLIPMADRDEVTGRLVADVLDIVDPATGDVRQGLTIAQDAQNAALNAWQDRVIGVRVGRDKELCRAARQAGMSASFTAPVLAHPPITGDGQSGAVESLIAAVGSVPDWFALDLFEYQQLGTLAALAGRNAICDAPGAGKTRQALAVIANLIERQPKDQPRRALVVVPPVVLTHWAREAAASGLTLPAQARTSAGRKPGATPAVGSTATAAGSPAAEGDQVIVVQPGRKVPDSPGNGIVVVADSILRARPGLVDELVNWSPSVLVYDEAHRARTWDSKVSCTMRDLAGRIHRTRAILRQETTVLPLTGTPMFTGSPAELLPLLQMSGHLDWVFGGRAAFAERFCRRDRFGRWVARKQNLADLRRLLDTHVWVRRHKADILPWLPPKRWVTEYVDVPLTEVTAARKDLVAIVRDWIDKYTAESGRSPDGQAVEQWCREQIGLLAPLREAAGLTKVPVAVAHVESWLADNPPRPDATGAWVFEQPLVLWAHHRSVISALSSEVSATLAKHTGDTSGVVGIIDGSTGASRRSDLVDRLQGRRLGVLICQITAAGVGLTLTACSSPVFVESDWTAQLVSQAEDRHHRPGQNRGVTLTALCAAGTLDEHMVRVRYNKEDSGAPVVGDVHGRATRDEEHDSDAATSPWQLLAEIVNDCLATPRRKRARAA